MNEKQINPIKESCYALLIAIFHEKDLTSDEAFELLRGNLNIDDIKNMNMEDEELLDILVNEYYKTNYTPKYCNIKQARTIYNRFGSWDNALILAGIPTKEEVKKDKENELDNVSYTQCENCKTWLPKDEEYFYNINSSNRKAYKPSRLCIRCTRKLSKNKS